MSKAQKARHEKARAAEAVAGDTPLLGPTIRYNLDNLVGLAPGAYFARIEKVEVDEGHAEVTFKVDHAAPGVPNHLVGAVSIGKTGKMDVAQSFDYEKERTIDEEVGRRIERSFDKDILALNMAKKSVIAAEMDLLYNQRQLANSRADLELSIGKLRLSTR